MENPGVERMRSSSSFGAVNPSYHRTYSGKNTRSSSKTRRCHPMSIVRVAYVIICLSVFLAQLSLSVKKYMAHRTITQVRYSFEFEDRPVPALTICNNNRYRKSFLNEWMKQHDTQDKPESVNTFDWMAMSLAGDQLLESGHKLESMLRSQQGFYVYSLSKWFWTLSNGNCFFTTSSPVNETQDVLFRYSSDIVRLNLTFDEEEYPDISQANKELKIIAHSKRTYPDTKAGIPLEPFQKYTVKTRIIITKYLPKPYPTSCEDKNDVDGIYFYEDCIYRCIEKSSMKYCGCIPLGEYILRQEVQQFKCTGKAIDPNCSTLAIQSFFDCFQACSIPCRMEEYETVFWKVAFPKPESCLEMREKAENVKAPGKIKRACLTPEAMWSDVEIEWKTLETKFVEYFPQVQLNDMLASIGGLLGLWLGVSVLNMPVIFWSVPKFFIYKTQLTKGNKVITA